MKVIFIILMCLAISCHVKGAESTGVSGAEAFERTAKSCNALPPTGLPMDPETLEDAARQTSATRLEVSLNGLWRCRPSLEFENEGFVPGPDDNWGWGRLPSVWDSSLKRSFAPALSLSPYLVEHPEILARQRPCRAWYGRVFEMPREAAGKSVLVSFRMINTRVVVYVDGQRAGEAVFPCGEVDLTPYAKPGVRQFLALDVTSWPRNKETMSYNAPDRVEKTASVVRCPGLTGDLALLIVPKKERVTDAWIECDTANGRATFVTEGVEHAVRAVATVWPEGGDERLSRRFEGLGSRFTVSWKDARRWDTHTPGNRYCARIALYGADGELLDETTPIRFGFRDVCLAGRDILLNGVPIHLRALYTPILNGPDLNCSKATALEACRRMLAEGFNFIIAGNYNFREGAVSHMDGILEACDETGMLFSFSLPHIRDFDVSLDKPEVASRYRELTKRILSLMRNHPSVITYAMNHNCTGYGGDQNPMRIDGKWYDDPATDAVGDFKTRQNARLAAAIVKDLDPTRPIYHHESGNLGDWITENIYLNWAPRQERSDWVEKWSETGVKPLFFVEWGLPHIASWSSYRGPQFIWTSVGHMNYWVSEYAAAELGDEAYDGSPALRNLLTTENRRWSTGKPFHYDGWLVRTVTNQYLGVQAHFIADNWRAHRTYGLTATLPWDQDWFFSEVACGEKSTERANPDVWRKAPGMHPGCLPSQGRSAQYWDGLGLASQWAPSATGEAFRRWNRPDLAYIGGAPAHTDKRHHYRPSERIEKTVVIINDRRVDQLVGWTVELGKETLSGEVRVLAGERAVVPVSVIAPAAAGNYQLVLRAMFEGNSVQKDAFGFRVLAPALAPSNMPLLYDPVGLTAAEFVRLGVKTVPTDLATVPTNKNPLLIVGRGALTRRLLDTRLIPVSSRGGRILVFEQTKEVLEACGFRVQEYGIRQAFARFARKGVSLDDGMLRDWAGASTLVPPCFTNTPPLEREPPRTTWAGYSNTRVWRCGNRAAVATVLPEKPTLGDWRALADGGFDLQYAPLLEWRNGDGLMTFCQFDVTSRTVADPAADDLVRHLVRTLGDPLGALVWPTPSGLQAHRLGSNRRVWGSFYADPRKSPGDKYVLSSGCKPPAELAACVEKGGWVLGIGLSAAEIRAVCPVAPPMVSTNDCWASRVEKIPLEFNGLSNAELTWRAPMTFDAFCGKVEDGNEAFRVIRHGKGRYVFMQVPPWTIDDTSRPNLRTTRRRAEYALSRLLGNLNVTQFLGCVRYADVPEPEDDPYRYIRW